MHFNQYLKKCRESARLTQEELVQNLYIYDKENFKALDTSMLSKWERGVMVPHMFKQTHIVKYFQMQSHKALPCFDNLSVESVEKNICKTAMHNLLGKSKKLVLDFPSSVIGSEELMVYRLREAENLDKYIAINVDLDKDFNHSLSGLDFEQFKSWAVNPVNSFYVCEYKEQFFGLLFSLRLKPEVFEKLIHFKILEKEIGEKDFADLDEAGSNYLISFFAMNETAASLLFIRYYAHLIANQNVIEKVGTSTMMEDAKKLIAHMHLQHTDSRVIEEDLTMQSYEASLADFLAHERVMKMIFPKKEIL